MQHSQHTDLSLYQYIKGIILNTTQLPADTIHVYIGVFCLLMAAWAYKKKLPAYKLLLPGILVSIGMEVFDLWDFYRAFGDFRIMASLYDLVNTNLLPVIIVVLTRSGWVEF